MQSIAVTWKHILSYWPHALIIITLIGLAYLWISTSR